MRQPSTKQSTLILQVPFRPSIMNRVSYQKGPQNTKFETLHDNRLNLMKNGERLTINDDINNGNP